EINVTMGRLRSIQVFVLGEVKNPGPYNVTAMSTITDGVIISGGPSEIGSLRSVRLKRGGKEIADMDFYDLFLRGDKSKDLRVQDGDVIFVPTIGPLVGVVGNVRRPAVYEIKGSTDLKTLLGLAGGVIPTAYTQQIQVERVEGNRKRIVVDINADDGGLEGFGLQDADLVKIFSIFDKDMNAVYIEGNVKRPGKLELKEGMRLSDVIKGPDDLLDETFLDYGLIKRFVRPAGELRLIPFDLGGLLNGDKEEDMELRAKDSIFVFSKWLFRDRPRASIEGEVRVEISVSLPALPDSVDLVALQRRKTAFDPVKGSLTFKGIMQEREREELLELLKEEDELKKPVPEKKDIKPAEKPVPQGVRAIQMA
ncbi:MAG: SLBB domain-containing protein, partial [Deltaproteobacteria bacterium]|nr:SLBB domain-containing protein [Deltaproteobacteria bacterium]